jgi:ADP-ribose pyrophosphatase
VKNDKPQGQKAGWKLLSTTYPIATPWVTVRQDRVRIDGAGEITFNYLESRGAVGVVPVTHDGSVILIRQYRYTVDDWLLEIPAGGMHDAGEAMPQDMALLELREEVGGTCRSIEYVGYFYSSVGNSSQPFHVFLAFGVELNGPQGLQPGERIEVVPAPAPEALRLAREGAMKDGVSALSVLMCESRLREHGFV